MDIAATADPTALTPDNLMADPYPVWERLRRDDPVHFFPMSHEYLITRWDDCWTAGKTMDVFVPSGSYKPLARTMGQPNILSMSGPDHLSLREGLNEGLRPSAVESYIEALARPIARRHIDAVLARGEADLTTELFEPISVRVIGSVLGLPDVDNDTLTRWFHALNRGCQNVFDDAAVWAIVDQVRGEIDAVMRPLVERVTREPDRSLVSHMVHGGMPEGQTRGFDDLISTIRVIILGGLQEPGHGAANAMYGLLSNPDQAAAVARDASAWALRAYDEGIRWIAPIGITPRNTSREFTLAGTVIPEGASVALVLASANRDPARFENPDAYLLDRPRKPNASFGYGAHYCSGNSLSREIGRISIEELFRAAPDIRLDPERKVEVQGWRFRGVTRLPAVWKA
jgi:cytochrome P450